MTTAEFLLARKLGSGGGGNFNLSGNITTNIVNKNRCSGYNAILDIPNNITIIDANSFEGLRTSSINFPPNLISIGNMAFYQNNKLENLIIPSVTIIGTEAFYGCGSLKSVDLPSNITTIGTRAFRNCYALANITVRATTPPTIQSNTFQSVPSDANIYVPAESVETYKTTNYWSDRANYIQAIS